MFLAFLDKDMGALEEAYLQQKNDPSSSRDTKATYYRFRYDLGDTSALELLLEMEELDDVGIGPSIYLSHIYMKLRAFDNAQRHASKAHEKARTKDEKSDAISLQSDVLESQGNLEGALANLFKGIREDRLDAPHKARLLIETANVLETMDRKERAAMSLEAALLHSPTDHDTRFKLAYLYSELGRRGDNYLSYYHYRILVNNDPKHHFAWNNFGAILHELGTKSLGISAWTRAIDEEPDNDYPAANIAVSLTRDGYLDEAGRVLNSMDSGKRLGKRARYADAKLEEAARTDEDARKKILSSANEAHQIVLPFCQNFDLLALQESDELVSIAGSYVGTSQTLELAVNAGSVTGSLETHRRLYDLTAIELDGPILIFKAEPKKIRGRLGLLSIGLSDEELPASEEQWREDTSGPELEFRLWQSIDRTLEGFRITGKTGAPVLVKYVKAERSTTGTTVPN